MCIPFCNLKIHREYIVFASLLFFHLSIINCSAQKVNHINLDSLWEISNDPNQLDATRLKAMNNIAWNGYLFSQPDSAFYFAQLNYDFAKSKGLKKQMARALNTQGVSFKFRGDYDSALHYHTRSLIIKEEIGFKIGIAASLNNIGTIYKVKGNYERAIDNYFRSLKIKEEIGDKKGITSSLNNLGIIYKIQGDYVMAVGYYTRSLTISEEIGNKVGVAHAFLSIGDTYKDQGSYASAIDYFNRALINFEGLGDKKGIATSLNGIGNAYMQKGDYIKAIDYHTRSLIISQNMEDKEGIAVSLNNIGIVYRQQGDYVSAIEYYTRSLIIKKETRNKLGICNSLNIIGNIYLEQGDSASITGMTTQSLKKYASAIDFSSRSLDIAQEIGFVIGSMRASKTLNKAYQAVGKYEQALEMYELHIAIRDSVESEQNRKIVIRQEYKYAYDKQKLADDLTHDAALDKETSQRYVLYTILILIVLFAIYIYRAFRIRKGLSKSLEISNSKLKELNLTKDRFFAIISHDLRGAITSFSGIGEIIDYYLDKKENDKIKNITKNIDQNANQLHNLLDNVLHWSVMEMGETTFNKKEIKLNILTNDMIKLYVTAAKSKEISLLSNVKEGVIIKADENAMNVIFRNFISNAIKFTPELGEININAISDEDKVILSFEDTGIGMEDSKAATLFDFEGRSEVLGTKGERGIGLGLKLCKHFIDQHGGRINVKSEINKGTTFSITIPVS